MTEQVQQNSEKPKDEKIDFELFHDYLKENLTEIVARSSVVFRPELQEMLNQREQRRKKSLQ